MLGCKETSELCAAGVEKNHGGKSFDFIFLGVWLVLLFDCLVTVGEIETNEDEFFGGGIHECFFGENVLVHHLAGRAPIRASELYQDGFLLHFGFCESLFQICGPSLWSGCKC